MISGRADSLRIAVAMTSAPRPRPTVQRTLAELRRAGFDQTIHLFQEPGTGRTRAPGVKTYTNRTRLGLWYNWRNAAFAMLQTSDAPFILICQDDLALIPSAAAALQHALRALPHERWGYASLYTPTHNVAGRAVRPGWQPVNLGGAAWGALAYCFTRESLFALLHSETALQYRRNFGVDAIVSQTLLELGRDCYYHVPSLAAHTGGGNSTVGHFDTPGFAALGYSPDYRAYDVEKGEVEKGEKDRPTRGKSRRSPPRLRRKNDARLGGARVAARRLRRLAAVCAYYNPCRYETRRRNFERFAAGMRDAGVELYVAEAGQHGRFDLPQSPRTFRFTATSSLWQKERLLNLAIERLPPEVDAVAWIDADILFESRDWPQRTLDLLREAPVAQLFATAVYLGPDGRRADWRPHCSQASSLAVKEIGHPGFAWAARRSALTAMGGLWDASICGGGDYVMADAFRGRLHAVPWYSRRWAERSAAVVGGEIGGLSERVFHLWHGTFENRGYAARSLALKKFGFHPQRDLRQAGGLWVWSKDAPPKLVKFVQNYFHSRQEDG